ncbi:hypothetical protein L289_3494 [Acinetobacter gerneri DSM 14967 = CIP 107464 = MTCC 9824]|nr:hypothetical protein L289_3494 [Acinetobacter gerneri DSM 14967 = CIP 107464 = MTCC 9824]
MHRSILTTCKLSSQIVINKPFGQVFFIGFVQNPCTSNF